MSSADLARRHGELLARRLMKHAQRAVMAAWQDDAFSEGNARQAASLIDAALCASKLPDFDPRLIQMELAGYFVGETCVLGAHGETFLSDVAEADLFGMTFVDQLSEAARRDGLSQGLPN